VVDKSFLIGSVVLVVMLAAMLLGPATVERLQEASRAAGFLEEGFRLEDLSLEKLDQWLDSLGTLGPVAYAGLYYLSEVFAVPASVLTFGAGFFFGPIKGTILASLCGSAAAGTSFLVARYVARDFMQGVLNKYPKFKAVDKAVAKDGFRFTFLLRLSPLFPFSLSNYLYGLTSVEFWPYLLGSWLGMLPGTALYVYSGVAGKAITGAALSSGPSTMTTGQWISLAAGGICTVALILYLGSVATKAIKEQEEEAEAADLTESLLQGVCGDECEDWNAVGDDPSRG